MAEEEAPQRLPNEVIFELASFEIDAFSALIGEVNERAEIVSEEDDTRTLAEILASRPKPLLETPYTHYDVRGLQVGYSFEEVGDINKLVKVVKEMPNTFREVLTLGTVDINTSFLPRWLISRRRFLEKTFLERSGNISLSRQIKGYKPHIVSNSPDALMFAEEMRNSLEYQFGQAGTIRRWN